MSAGRLSTMVETAAYEQVAIANTSVIQRRLWKYTVAIRQLMPATPTTITHFLAAPTGMPPRMSRLETPPPRKLPASAATNGTQKASRLSSNLNPLATRYTANQSVMKNHTGSVSDLATMTPHVWGSRSSWLYDSDGGRALSPTAAADSRSPRISRRSASVSHGCASGGLYTHRNSSSQANPSAPTHAKTGRHVPKSADNPRTIAGATAAPIDEPLSNSATAQPLSRRGNHSETALVAPGQLADSPRPSRKRNPMNERSPLANDVSMAAVE